MTIYKNENFKEFKLKVFQTFSLYIFCPSLFCSMFPFLFLPNLLLFLFQNSFYSDTPSYSIVLISAISSLESRNTGLSTKAMKNCLFWRQTRALYPTHENVFTPKIMSQVLDHRFLCLSLSQNPGHASLQSVSQENYLTDASLHALLHIWQSRLVHVM